MSQPAQIFEELFTGIGSEVCSGDFGFRQVRHQAFEVVSAVVHHAHGTGGESRVAATKFEGCSFEQGYPRPMFCSADCSAERRVATADDEHLSTFNDPAVSKSIPSGTA